MKIIDYLKDYLIDNNFGKTSRSETMDILSSATYGYYKTKTKTRNFWDKAYFLLIDDSWDHKLDLELLQESAQLEHEIIPYFKKNIIGEYAFINKTAHNNINTVKFQWWGPESSIKHEKLNEQFKYVKRIMKDGNFADGFCNKGFKLKVILFVVSEIDWTSIENIPENLLLIYDDRAKQTNFPDSNNRIKTSFQEIRNIENKED